ncbi:hypothetical protein [Radicibacter daui]|uniref:hypothetical protein n=1 Tax=Radicibacter daui TaxID=3064829 RepID=UPI004046B7D8
MIARLTGISRAEVRRILATAKAEERRIARRQLGVAAGLVPLPASNRGNPLERAMAALGGRVSCKRSTGEWRLDGRPSSPRAVVEAANRRLAEAGLPLIAYPGVGYEAS